jgi:hypothetical protein
MATHRDRIHTHSKDESDQALKKNLKNTDRMRAATLRPKFAADKDKAEKCLQRKKAFNAKR